MNTVDAVKEFCGVTDGYSDTLIASFMEVADSYIVGAIGKCFIHDPRVDLIQKVLVNDMLTNRTFTGEKGAMVPQRLVSDMLLQLKLEQRVHV